MIRRAVSAGLVLWLAALCMSGTAQQSAIDGTKLDRKTGKSRDEALRIEDARFRTALAALEIERHRVNVKYASRVVGCQGNRDCVTTTNRDWNRDVGFLEQIRIQAKGLNLDNRTLINTYWSTRDSLRTASSARRK